MGIPEKPGSFAKRRPSQSSKNLLTRASVRMSPIVSELTSLSLVEARDGLKKKSFSAGELATAHLTAIEKARALNAFVLETPERATEMAKASDARIAQGKAGPLEGIPLAIKTCSARAGIRSTACSHILDNFVPTYESTVTSQLWRDGAVLLGKTNCDEFAMGSSNETSYFGAVHSPWRRKGSNTPLTPGGSSGGSACRRRGAAVLRRDRHRHRRFDPPAGSLYRYCRHETDLWPVFALGDRRLRVVPRPGRAVRAHRARCGHSHALDGGARPERYDLRRHSGA
jgi:hypothetical protein